MRLFLFIFLYLLLLALEIVLFTAFPPIIALVIGVTQIISFLFGYKLLVRHDIYILTFLDTELKKKNAITMELWDECLLVIGCILLMLIGIFSDLIGAFLLMPAVRKWIMQTLLFDRTI